MQGFIKHRVSFSDSQFGTNGAIDCEGQNLCAIHFYNQGTVDVFLNGIILTPGTSRSYEVRDENVIIHKITYEFDPLGVGKKILVVSRAKRVGSIVVPVKEVCNNA